MKTIFVAIASYRDTECQWTIKDLFEMAEIPNRITVGICWQFDQLADTACFIEPYPYPQQVKSINFSIKEAKGACWAKAKALSLSTDEDYVLLIDSHMRFAKNWDTEMISMLNETNNKKSFLSTYPAKYDPPNQRSFDTPRLRPVRFFDRVMSQNSIVLNMPNPIKSYMVAGGYLFCPHLMLKQIPYDPYIYFIGEEIAHAARFFTHGWVGYTPHKCLIHHFYTRKESIKQWEDDKQTWSTLDAASLERVRHLFGIERTTNPLALAEIEKYGLGSDRSLSEFQTCIGVNFNAQFIHRQRHESLDAIQSSINNPAPPISTFEMSTLGIYACRHGYYLLPKQDAYIGKSLIEYGEWVEGINALFSKIFPTGGVALEVGSGFGAHTIPLARLAGKDGRIFAIEQSRRLTELLHANIALNGLSNVRVTQAHIGSTVGSVKIREPLFTSTSNFGLISHVTDIDSEKYTDQITTLDSIIYDRLDLIFIDTPGMVNEIVTSGIATILKHTPIIIINSDNTEDTKIATELLLKIGFNLQNEYFYFFDKNNYLGNKNNIFNSLVSNVLVARFNR